jgi:hypothetical protein
MTLRRSGLVVAAVLLLIAVFRPTLGDGAPSVTSVAGERAPNIFLIVDRSAEMSSRMALARDDINAVIDRYPDARFSLISFDARPSLDWPLSADSWSLRAIVAAADSYPRGTDVMTNAGAASTVLRYQLISALQQYPRAENLVFYFGAGAPDSTAPQREFQIPENSVDGGAVFGYGAGGAAVLQAVADQLGVDHLQREQIQSVAEVIPDPAEVEQRTDNASASSGFELYWVLAGIAALLILVELYHALRHLRRTRLDRISVGR